MKRLLKRLLIFNCTALIFLSLGISVFAADSSVTYEGQAEKFIFAPGSSYSPTDLFSDFKGVMPGDSITQQIVIKNDVKNNVKIKLYLKSLGAHDDSKEFLSQMNLKVSQDGASNLFDAPSDRTAGLTEWVYLGTIYSGGDIKLNVTLDVPADMGNEFKSAVGLIDWQFKVEELPISPDDPKPPKTGDTFNPTPWVLMMVSSLAMIILMIAVRRRKENTDGCTK